MQRAAARIVCVGLVAIIVLFNVRLLFGHRSNDVTNQLAYLRSAIERGDDEQMQGIFPEGYFLPTCSTV